MRITNHPILGTIQKQDLVQIYFNGEKYDAVKGESIAAALLANGIRTLRYSEKEQQPRGIYCGIGHCYECRVSVDGSRSTRACITPVRDSMTIESQGYQQSEC